MFIAIIKNFHFVSSNILAFTSLYGRWQIWIVLVGIIFIIPTLDRFEEVDRRLISVNLIFNYLLATAAFTIAIDANKLPTDYLKEYQAKRNAAIQKQDAKINEIQKKQQAAKAEQAAKQKAQQDAINKKQAEIKKQQEAYKKQQEAKKAEYQKKQQAQKDAVKNLKDTFSF